jgi:hypothetical protein
LVFRSRPALVATRPDHGFESNSASARVRFIHCPPSQPLNI